MGFASPAPVRAPVGLRLRGSPALTCAALASAPAALYVATQPRVGDFAAQVYRSRLFGRMPLSVWDGNWYGGHHLPGYSVLFPPFGWLLGPALLAAIASVGAAAAFAALVDRQFGPAARPGGWWFATLGIASELFAGRLTFMVGLALALGSLLALQRERPGLSVALAVATSLASPVAALFLALAGAALAVARLGRRAGAPAAVAVAALLPALVLFTLFPEGVPSRSTRPTSLRRSA
jgi:hypothetical protein